MEAIFTNTGNSKTNDFIHKFVVDLPKRLNLKSSNKYAALQNLSIYYMWNNIRQQYKNSKLNIQYYTEYIIKRRYIN